MFPKLSNGLRRPALILLMIMLTIVALKAQRSSGDVGIGAQFGQPSGVTLNIYNPSGMSADLLVAWNLDDFIFFNLHGIYEKHIGNSGNLHFIYGPGFFVGLRDSNGELFRDDDVAVGISGTLGLSVLIDRLEIYGRVTPRLELIESTRGDIGGGLGLRFYF